MTLGPSDSSGERKPAKSRKRTHVENLCTNSRNLRSNIRAQVFSQEELFQRKRSLRDKDSRNLIEGVGVTSLDHVQKTMGRRTLNRTPQGCTSKLELDFLMRLYTTKKYQIKVVASDGSCLYRSVALQVYDDEELAQAIRHLVHEYMVVGAVDFKIMHWDFFCNFVTVDKDTYLSDLLKPTTYGDHPEIQAISEIFRVPIEIYTYDITPSTVVNCGVMSPQCDERSLPINKTPIRLSFHNNNHYNAVIDTSAPALSSTIILPHRLKRYKLGDLVSNLHPHRTTRSCSRNSNDKSPPKRIS